MLLETGGDVSDWGSSHISRGPAPELRERIAARLAAVEPTKRAWLEWILATTR